MKKIILLSIIFISCSCSRKVDYEELLEDRVWLGYYKDDEHPDQLYFESESKKNYSYNAIEEKNGGNDLSDLYSPWVQFKGIPNTNPFPDKYYSYAEGWLSLSEYKIVDNKVMLQSESDLKGERVTIYDLNYVGDTIIGIHKYDKILRDVIQPDGSSYIKVWVSKIN